MGASCTITLSSSVINSFHPCLPRTCPGYYYIPAARARIFSLRTLAIENRSPSQLKTLTSPQKKYCQNYYMSVYIYLSIHLSHHRSHQGRQLTPPWAPPPPPPPPIFLLPLSELPTAHTSIGHHHHHRSYTHIHIHTLNHTHTHIHSTIYVHTHTHGN